MANGRMRPTRAQRYETATTAASREARDAASASAAVRGRSDTAPIVYASRPAEITAELPFLLNNLRVASSSARPPARLLAALFAFIVSACGTANPTSPTAP